MAAAQTRGATDRLYTYEKLRASVAIRTMSVPG